VATSGLARDAANHPTTVHRRAPTTKNDLSQKSAVLRVRTSDVKNGLWSQADLV
jgi:hypothetical protein